VDSEHLSGAKRALLERRLRGETKGNRDSRPVTPGGQPGPIPLSVVQEDLWYFSQLAPDNPVYNELITIRKTGTFKHDAFKRAFNELVRRHEAWRTTFLMMDGQPVQVVQPPMLVDLSVTDLSDCPRREAEEYATDMAAKLARQPYELEKGPLVRPLLVRFGEDEHRLYLALQHLTVDAVSLYRVVLPELVALYDSFAAEEQPALPEPTTQYADYARWSQEWTKSEAYARRMEYWRRHLEGAPELQLPLDHPRPRQQRFRGGMERVRLDEALVRQLRSLGFGEGATLFQVLASAFAVLLHRYTAGQDDVVFGIVSDLRQRTEFEAVVGYCFNSVVVRADLGEDPSFKQLLGRLRTELLDDLAQQVPFGRLVGDLHPARDASINPFFQALLVLLPPPSSTDPEWSLYQDAKLGNAVGIAKLDLTLQLDERPEGHIDSCLIYNSDIFDAQTAQRVTGHWLTLLENITARPDALLSELELLTAEEIHRQVVERNATEVPHQSDACVHELFEEQVRRDPDAVALSCEGEHLSYGELNRRANGVARRLRELGVVPDLVVGVHLERSLELVVGLLGVLKAGGAYLPLDPSCPIERLGFMISDAGVSVVVTQEQLRGRLSGQGVQEVVTEENRDGEDTLASGVRPENLAYVIYTSGSTGTPKGVMVEHRNVVRLFGATDAWFGFGQEDVWTLFHSFAFDFSVWEMWGALLHGGRLVVVPYIVSRSPELFHELLERERVTVLNQTPLAFRQLIEEDGRRERDLWLRVVVFGGEALDVRSLRGWVERHGDEKPALVNMYGITETTVHVTYQKVTAAQVDGGSNSIGQPISDLQVYVLDAGQKIVPPGIAGEMYVGGAGVARGYLGREELTRERFVANPFVEGGRLYRSGDLGRYGPNGRLEYLGRGDDQVKIRGFRIEPGEVEAVLFSHPRVAAAAVVAREDGPGGRSLVAYVVPRDAMPTAAELRDVLRQRLPEYMVPAAFVALEHLPLTSNGKLDRALLPAPDRGRDSDRTYVAPRTDAEERIAALWDRILQRDRVGIHDDFFEIGGHSLLAVRMLDEMEREFGVEIPLVSFFNEDVTVAGLAAVVENAADRPASRGVIFGVHTLGASPVIFAVYPDPSSMLTLRHFTNPLGSDHRIVGLLPDRNGRRFDRSRGVEDLAPPMLEAIRSVQPSGPYRIFGYSFGGLLAYELASRLRECGDDVAWLGLLDAAVPGAPWGRGQRRLPRLRRLARQRDLGPRQALRLVDDVVRREFRALLVRLHVRPMQMRDWDWRGARKLEQKYRCRPNDAPLDIFATEDSDTEKASSLGWDTIHLGPLRVHHVPGDHKSMVQEPYVSILTDELVRSLHTVPELAKVPTK
jgi:amino acid adenylation domain-containing protein